MVDGIRSFCIIRQSRRTQSMLTFLMYLSNTENKAEITDDPFIKAYIDDVLRSLRTQYLIDLIKPYTRMELSFLARVSAQSHWRSQGRRRLFGWLLARITSQQLNIETDEVEDILIGLILDGKVKGRVDQVNGRLELDRMWVSSLGTKN